MNLRGKALFTILLFMPLACACRPAAPSGVGRPELAVHEAGHAVFAWFDTSFAVGPVEINGGKGNAAFTPPRGGPSIADVWRLAAGSVAGGRAVFQETRTVPNGTEGDVIIRESATEYLLFRQAESEDIDPPWATGEPRPELYAATDIQKLAADRATAVLAAHARELRRVAAELERRNRLEVSDLQRLLGPRRVSSD